MKQAADTETKYQVTCDSYDRLAQDFARKHSDPEKILPLMTPFTRCIPKGGKIMDAGCGPGRDASVFLAQGFKVVGVDFSAEMLHLASSVEGLETHLCDLRDIDLHDETFDGVWANACLHHLDEKDLAPTLFELARLLKPGGVLFAGVKRGKMEGFTEEYASCPRFYRKYWIEDLTRALTSVGLVVFETCTSPGDDGLPGWLFVYAVKPTQKQLLLDFGCRLCQLVSNEELNRTPQVNGLPLYDRLLLGSQNFNVFPALGHVLEGYVMIITRKHVLSMGALPCGAWDELTTVKRRIREIMEPVFGPLVFFEHGSVHGGLASGSSITHAHMHSAPAPEAFLNSCLTALPFAEVEPAIFASSSYAAGMSYLTIENSNNRSFGCRPPYGLATQYLRRHLARAVGESGQWHWRYYPFTDRVLRTLRRLEDLHGSLDF